MPRGRPAAPRFIVNPNEILITPQVINEKHTITTLARSMSDSWACIQWCARRGLIKNSRMCQTCNVECGLINRGDIEDGKTWYCSICKNKTSIRHGSWFEDSHLSLYNIILLTYCWAYDFSQNDISREVQCNKNTCVDWCNFCRELCQTWLQNSVIDKSSNIFPHILLAVRSAYHF